MFTENATSSLPFGSIVIHRIATAIENVVLVFWTWVMARHTRSVLSNLSDQQLADIGLSRSDIR